MKKKIDPYNYEELNEKYESLGKELYSYLKKNKPNVRILGSDYDIPDKRFTGDNLDIDIYYHKRDHNWSSTEMRQRIIKNEKKA